MEACVVSSTSLVHVGNSCIRVVAESSIMGRLNSGMSGNRHFRCQTMHASTRYMDQGTRKEWPAWLLDLG